MAAERRLKVERHVLAGVGGCERADGSKREHAVAACQGDVVLKVHIDSVEVELAEIVVVELRCSDFVPAAGVWIRLVVSPVEGGGCLNLDEVGLGAEPRGGRRAEYFFSRRESAIRSLPNTRTEIGCAGAKIQLVGPPMYGASGFDCVEEVIRAIGLEAVHADAEVVLLRKLV